MLASSSAESGCASVILRFFFEGADSEVMLEASPEALGGAERLREGLVSVSSSSKAIGDSRVPSTTLREGV